MTVGEALAEARSRAGLTVDEVSERTRIRETVILCIEQDDYAACGGDLYVRGYVRAIAGAVGIDAQPLIREFDAARAAVPGSAPGPLAAEPRVIAPPPASAPGPAASDSAATMFELPETPAGPDATAADPGSGGAADPTFTAADPELTADPGPSDVDHGFTATDPAIPAIDPTDTAADLGFPAFDTESLVLNPGYPPIDPGFPPWEPGFTAADPGFTTAEWQYTVADQSFAPDDPNFAATLQTLNGAHATPNGAESLLGPADPALPAFSPAYGHPRGKSPRRSRIRGRRWVTGIVVLVAIALAVVGLAGSKIVSSLRHTSAANAATGTEQTTPAKPSPTVSTAPAQPKPKPAPLPARSLNIALAEAFGPVGMSDGDNPQIASYAITPGSPSPWQTDWYATADFGKLKHGTGLLLDMGKMVTITSVRFDLSAFQGANLQLRTGVTPVLSGLRVTGRMRGVGGTVRMRFAAPVRTRYLLIWFTLLPPNGAGKYQESISHIVVKGRP